MSSKERTRIVDSVVCAAGVGVFVLVVFWLGSSFEIHQPPPIVVGEQSEESLSVERGVAFCLPLVEKRTGTQLIGVAVIDLSQPREQNHLKGASIFSPECQLGKESWRSSISIQNVVVSKSDGSQRLLFSGPTMVKRVVFPDEDCDAGVGVAPCGHLYWEVREFDTNGDGVIDNDDALASYLSEVDVSGLWRMNPAGSTVVASQRDVGRGSVFLQLQVDQDEDGVFGPMDPAPLVEYSVQARTLIGEVITPEVAKSARQILIMRQVPMKAMARSG